MPSIETVKLPSMAAKKLEEAVKKAKDSWFTSTFDIITPALTPWADDARIARDGALLYCPVVEKGCMDAMNRRAAAAPESRRTEVDISRTFLGIPGPVTRYAIVAIPPE